MKKVLVLGAGMISRPLVGYLLNKGYLLTVADMDQEKSLAVTGNHASATAVELDVNNEEELEAMVAEHDIVVSLLPFTMHLLVAKLCIRQKRSLVTTSYQSQGMLELKPQIEESGITVLNEMGLDPGIDHMSARKIIDRVHSMQGQVYNFYSLCGALPAPESVDNPLGYKFTWSPAGVMTASLSNAKYLRNSEVVEVPADLLFHNPFKIEFPEVGVLDVYPNRDSVSYIKEYGIEEVRTMLRGTLRLPGWCETIDAMKRLGLLDQKAIVMENMSYFNLVERKLGTLYPEYEAQLAKFLRIDVDSSAIRALRWLGYFSNAQIGRLVDAPFNVASDLMFAKMMLHPDERDMVVMQHELLVRYPGEKEEKITARLLEYGEPNGDTAIARTVALPAAIAVDLILTGQLTQTGLLRPLSAEIYEPVLEKLEEEGIVLREEVSLPV